MLSTKINYFYLLFFLIFISQLTSCGSKQEVVYFQNVDAIGTSNSINSYNQTIKPDDKLTIVVSALDLDVARPFNLTTISYMDETGGVRPTQQTYLVDSNGNIEFPVLGTIKLAGLSRIQATNLIKGMLDGVYIKNPIVNIRIINFKVTVLGEVNRPGTYTIPNERVTVLEALGLAGDLSIQAERNNILVVREQNGKITHTRIDLSSPEIFNSPVYYLSQNDVIYVEPNSSKAKSSKIGPDSTLILSVVGTLITAAALVVSITK